MAESERFNPMASSDKPALLEVDDLHAGYSAGNVLRGIRFTLAHGEICALLGENGSGKTTLLRAVCGLLPYRGSCALDGTQVRKLSDRERARHIGWLSQREAAPLSLSGLDAVLMGFNPMLGMLESPTREQRHRAMALLEKLGAAELAGRDFTRLSAGQRQLLLLARALVRDTELLALDEPESALDLNRRHMLFQTLRERTANGCAILMSSHDVNAALRWADRLLLLREGMLCARVDLRTASHKEIEDALRNAFGPVELIEYAGQYFMAEM